MPALANINECTGCLACVDSCPVGALSSSMSDEHHLTYSLDFGKCISCDRCEKSCPIVTKFPYGCNDIKLSTLYAGWTTDFELRKLSSSGGIFGALAKAVISENGVVIGASLEGYRVYHRAIYKVEDIHLLQGSKYTQSDTVGIYKTVRENLKTGKKVLFSGLGCQVAGLLSYLGDKFDRSNLLTVDIICSGVPSSFLMEQFAKENIHYPAAHAFRNKQEYEFSVYDNDGHIKVIPLSEKPLPLCGFYTERTNRMSCYDCQFAYVHRLADITIGDFWGDVSLLDQHKNGISAIVAHSENGKEWLYKSDIDLHEGDWRTFLLHNHRMVDGKNNLGACIERRNLGYAIAHYNRRKFLVDYANYATVWMPWTWAKKIWRYIQGRINPSFDKDKVIKIIDQK